MCMSLGTWWKIRKRLVSEVGGEEREERDTSSSKAFQGLGVRVQ